MTLRMVLSFSREKCAFVSAQNNLNLNLRDSDNSKQSFSPCKEGPVYDWFITVPTVLVFDTYSKLAPSPPILIPLSSHGDYGCLGFWFLAHLSGSSKCPQEKSGPTYWSQPLRSVFFHIPTHDSLLFNQFFDTFKQLFGIFSSCVHQDGTSNFLVLSFTIFLSFSTEMALANVTNISHLSSTVGSFQSLPYQISVCLISQMSPSF